MTFHNLNQIKLFLKWKFTFADPNFHNIGLLLNNLINNYLRSSNFCCKLVFK